MSKVNIYELENDTNFLNTTSPEHSTSFKPAKRKAKLSANVFQKNGTSTRNINSSKVLAFHSSSKERGAVFVKNIDKEDSTRNDFSKMFGSSQGSVIFSPPKKSNVYVKNIIQIEELSCGNAHFAKVFESSKDSVLDSPPKKGSVFVKKVVRKYKSSTGNAVLIKKVVEKDKTSTENPNLSKVFQSLREDYSVSSEEISQQPTNSSLETTSINSLTVDLVNESTLREHSRILFDQLEKCIAINEKCDFLNTLQLSTVSSSDNSFRNVPVTTEIKYARNANLSPQQWFDYSGIDNSSKLANSEAEITFGSTFSSSILSACKLKRRKNASQKKSKARPQSSVSDESSYLSVSKASNSTFFAEKNVKLTSKRIKRKSDSLPSKLKSKLPPFDQFCNTNFYNYLIKKIEPKFGVSTNQEVVKLVKFISDIVKETSYSKKDPNENVNLLKKTLFEYGVVVTHYDFNSFCSEYLPIRFRNKAIPMGKSSNIEFNPRTLFEPIA